MIVKLILLVGVKSVIFAQKYRFALAVGIVMRTVCRVIKNVIYTLANQRKRKEKRGGRNEKDFY